QLVEMDPLYQLTFDDATLLSTPDHEEMKARVERTFPGNGPGVDRFMRRERRKYDAMYPCLKMPYDTLLSMLNWRMLAALPHMSIRENLFGHLGHYFSDDRCRLSFTFQAKYLGMSPWECPAAFAILPYIERAYGIHHVMGGLSRISDAMARVIEEHGGEIHTDRAVTRIITDSGRRASGIALGDGERIDADAVVINADFGYAMENLFEPGFLRTYTPAKLSAMRYSCSTFMLYLGLDTIYDEPHHHIIFASDYRRNMEDIAAGRPLSDDMSIYIRNAVATDSTLAPPGQSALYVLVPISNLLSGFEWTADYVAGLRDTVLTHIEQRTAMHDLRRHIVAEHMITPRTWKDDYNLFAGSTFNLSHNLAQLLYFRPHNRFEECRNCYLAGGGTHPGSGLPTIYESGRIAADLICKDV
ncbi:MAG: phytoene desaturase, partial [Chitinivibrionales bacterium]|nr:phytoene desaturase [Chitinivibrionales bacterium]